MSGERKLPSKNEMREDQMAEAERLWKKGYPRERTHDVARDQKVYQKQLSDLAGIKNLPDVFYDMYFDIYTGLTENPSGFRKYRYTIIDDHTFVKERAEN